MDARPKRVRTNKNHFAATLGDLAEAARTIQAQLQVEWERPQSTFATLAGQCQAAWPVEGGSREEVLQSLALMLVLRRVATECLGEAESAWEGLDRHKRLGPLARAAEAAERLPRVHSELAKLQTRFPHNFPSLVATAANQQRAAIPMSVVYEGLLTRFDRQQRAKRGVFHTPAPVARWMVEATGWALAKHFASAEAFRFLDPGCGCGTFLAELLQSPWLREISVGRPPPSFVGYELLPTALAIANWAIDDRMDERPANLELRWANPLLAGEDEAGHILGSAGGIERGAVPVILGNPPYANYGRSNRGPWIDGLLADYRIDLRERKSNLSDDFIKFIRWGQYWIERAGRGVMCVVTSNTYLSGITHRSMRRSLLDSFDDIYVLDLHGDPHRIEPSGAETDENVFEIRSGVAIGLFAKRDGRVTPRVSYASLRASRQKKFSRLESQPAANMDWKHAAPAEPLLSFVPQAGRAAGSSATYAAFWPLTDIFSRYVSGVQTKHDALFVDLDRDRLAARMKEWLCERSSAEKSASPPLEFDEDRLRPYLVAPFDRRWLYYEPRLLGRARQPVMRHLLQPNLGLVFMRQSTNAGEYDHFLAVDCLVSDRVFFSRHGAPYLAPLWLYDGQEVAPRRSPNLAPAWLDEIAGRLGEPVDPLAAFHFLYAVVHRSDYRQTFAAELRQDFPRVPLPSNRQCFAEHASLGAKLVALHVEGPESPLSDKAASEVRIGGYNVLARWRKRWRDEVERRRAVDEEQRLRASLARTSELRAELDQLGRPWE